MKQVVFYILSSNDSNVRYNFCCKVIEKVFKLKLRILVLCCDLAEISKLDQLLWAFKEDSFIPHLAYDEIYNGTDIINMPVVIADHVKNDDYSHYDILISLNNELVDLKFRSKKVLYIVDQGEDNLEKCRELYKKYKELGYKIQIHNLD